MDEIRDPLKRVREQLGMMERAKQQYETLERLREHYRGIEQASGSQEMEAQRLMDEAALLAEFVPSPSQMRYESNSANTLVANLQKRYDAKSQTLPNDVELVLYAVLANGDRFRVDTICAEGHSGVSIESDGAMLLLHQYSLQLLCCEEKIEIEGPEPRQKRPPSPPGFIVYRRPSEAGDAQ